MTLIQRLKAKLEYGEGRAEERDRIRVDRYVDFGVGVLKNFRATLSQGESQ